MIKRKGLAQIPLMIGLLIMAVVVPVATKLVQESQDTRNQAAGCLNQYCASNSACCTGYICQNYLCKLAVTPTPTKRPTSTPAPTCTNYTRRCNGKNIERCLNNIWYTVETCSFSCSNALCVNPTNTPRPPTATPTKRPPTPTPNPNACNSVYETRKCVNSAEYTCTNNVWVKTKTCSGPCVHNACPTPTTCLGLGDPCTTESCCSGLKCSGGGYGAFECIPDTTISPPATAIPTLSGCSASKLYQCGSLGGCGVGYRCMLSGSYYCKYDSSCPGGPTNTPTATPTEKPTATPTSSGPLKCYCVDNCANDECNWQSASGGGYNRYCSVDSCKYIPTPRQPTATPTKTCSKTGGACNSQGDCCSGNVCWNGHCYISSGPSPTPTTGTNPPNPPGGCSGSKPADKCESKTLFINAQCINNQWDWDEKLCNSTGRKEVCGGTNYCCPTTGGSWTTDMSKCPTTCTQCAGKPEAKSKGDADCSGVTNLNDFSIWRGEFITGALGVTVKNSWRADFDCNGKVNLNDFSIWRDNFIKSL